MKYLFLLLALPLLLRAEDLKLRNGNTYHNIEIVKKEDGYLYFRYNNQGKILKYSDIAEITDISYMGDKQSTFEELGRSNYDPCQDKVLIQLSKKDSLSTDEMKMYVELRKLCENSKQVSRDLTNRERAVEVAEDAKDSAKSFYAISIVIAIASTIYLLVK